jgi:hypothetical protein
VLRTEIQDDPLLKKILTGHEIEVLIGSFELFKDGSSFLNMIEELSEEHPGIRELLRRLLDIHTVIQYKKSLPSKEEAVTSMQNQAAAISAESDQDITPQMIVKKIWVPGIPLENEVLSLLQAMANSSKNCLPSEDNKSTLGLSCTANEMAEASKRQKRLGTPKKTKPPDLNNHRGMSLFRARTADNNTRPGILRRLFQRA